MLGKAYYEKQDYANCLKNYENCYKIRKEIQKPTDPDFQRIVILIEHLKKSVQNIKILSDKLEIEEEEIKKKLKGSQKIDNNNNSNNDEEFEEDGNSKIKIRVEKKKLKKAPKEEAILFIKKDQQKETKGKFIFDIPITKKFLDTLKINQLKSLTKLKNHIKFVQKNDLYYNATEDVFKSDFFKELDQNQLNEFMEYFRPYVEFLKYSNESKSKSLNIDPNNIFNF